MRWRRSAQHSRKAGGRGQQADGAQPRRKLPDKKTALEILDKMLLIRHFEERAQEMYMKAKIGGFLHLAHRRGGDDRRHRLRAARRTTT